MDKWFVEFNYTQINEIVHVNIMNVYIASRSRQMGIEPVSGPDLSLLLSDLTVEGGIIPAYDGQSCYPRQLILWYDDVMENYNPTHNMMFW